MKDNTLARVYNRSLIGPLLFAAVIFAFPLAAQSNYLLSLFIVIGFYSLVAIGLSLLMGYAGQISLGHAAFYGIGAYMSAIISGTYGLSPWLGMAGGAALSALIAFIVGIPTFKLKGHYLALATLGFGVIVFTAFKELRGLTGGMNGFFGIPALNIGPLEINSDFRYFYLVWAFVVAALLFSRNMIQSRTGRALRSIEGSEVAADALGINIMKYKLQVFVLSAVFASVSGSLYAHYVTFINPQLFEAMTSIYFLIMVVIGGVSSIWGAVIGAFVFVMLSEVLKSTIPLIYPSAGGEFEIVFFGLLLVVTLIYMPNGLMPTISRLGSKIKTAGQPPVQDAAAASEQIKSGGGKQ